MPAKLPGSAETLEDYFYATNSLLEYTIRLIETTPTDRTGKDAFREAACVQLRLLGEFLSDNETRAEKKAWRKDDQCLADYFGPPSSVPSPLPPLWDANGTNRWRNGDLKDLREGVNKTVAHLSLNRGSGKSISDRELANGIHAIWPAVEAFQKLLAADLRDKVAHHIAAQSDAWARFRLAYLNVSESVSDGSEGGVANAMVQ